MTDTEAMEAALERHLETSDRADFYAGWEAARQYYQQPEWREQAYARLGAVRDRMRSLDVEGVQAFLADRDR